MRCRRKRMKSSFHCPEESNNGMAPVVEEEPSHFTAAGRHKALNVDRCVSHAGRLSDMAVLRNCMPERQDSFEATVPTPMPISWENCFRTLRVIYTEAVKKIRGSVNNQSVVRVSDGQFRASVEVTEDPYIFSGQPASTQEGALAKLFYAVIKYVNVQLGYSIFDLHYGMRQYQDEHVDRFDRNMKAMLRSGEMLYLLSDETRDLFDQC